MRTSFKTLISNRVFHWQFLITYIFSLSLKFRTFYITGQWGDFTVKNATLYLHILYWHFWLFFHLKKSVFIILVFFWWSIEFPKQNINQSETGIWGKKLSVELYVCMSVRTQQHGNWTKPLGKDKFCIKNDIFQLSHGIKSFTEASCINDIHTTAISKGRSGISFCSE